MIKAVLREPSGAPVIVLGLSGENMARLMANEPIIVQAADLGLPPMKILVMGGRTEAEMTAALTSQFGSPRQTIQEENEEG
ncbi:hypothetical protein ABZX77_30435 [Streptomyces sp. NPDC004237]|uniref:hypothetical protein n=1 Tax=Streptomyces sp. NPDC004237 TaxID=3154455 RepID=UPI0033ADB1F9